MWYRKKPVEIEAFRLGIDDIPDWFMDNVAKNNVTFPWTWEEKLNADIKTLEGVMHAKHGDYIIKGVQGEIYPCKADIFNATYEIVE